jgi:GNAT superfamily N-acetyltransferase
VNVSIATTDEAIERCFPVMVQLHPTVTREEFMKRVRRQQRSGYTLAFLEDGDNVRTVAGFVISEGLSWGKFLYIDDLVTDAESRSEGYGGILLDWLVEYAKAKQCTELHLDSGVQRFAAHRFYMRRRLHIVCYHFSLGL